MKEYLIVFDTNILFKNYDKRADFCNFSFNATYENVVSMISQLDIYDKVTIAIPMVVWNEMEKQIIDAHRTKLTEYKTYIEKWLFPEFSIVSNDYEDYQLFIKSKIAAYRHELESGLCEVIALPIPQKERFTRIVDRAFAKQPPFGGKEKTPTKVSEMYCCGKVFLNLASLIH